MGETPPVPQRVAVGDLEVVTLTDAVGSFGTYDELFPGVPAGAWGPWRAAFPELFEDGGRWRLPFRSFLVTGGDETVLIDTGIGPRGPEGPAFLPERQGWLLEQLDSVEVSPEDVDVVCFTHLHVDHIGWNLVDGDIVWPAARFVAPVADWEWIQGRSETQRKISMAQLEPLYRAGVLELASEDTVVADSIRMVPTPGHTPGHCCVLIESGNDQAVVIGDIAVHPAMVTEPEWSYALDVDAGKATHTRTAFLEEIASSNAVVLCGHYPGAGIGRVGRDATLKWEPRAGDRA